jgi:hypothetical protein
MYAKCTCVGDVFSFLLCNAYVVLLRKASCLFLTCALSVNSVLLALFLMVREKIQATGQLINL